MIERLNQLSLTKLMLNKNKKIFLIGLALIIIAGLIFATQKKTSDENNTLVADSEEQSPTTMPSTEPDQISITITPTNTPANQEKLDLQQDLCTQISQEFVSNVTGINIARMGTINDVSISACDYYLTDEKNSPYIAIIFNKNLAVATQKEIAQKMKFVLKTDESITGEHYVVWADQETRIVNINLIIDEKNFIRIDKNVERAIDNQGLINLASGVSKKL